MAQILPEPSNFPALLGGTHELFQSRYTPPEDQNQQVKQSQGQEWQNEQDNSEPCVGEIIFEGAVPISNRPPLRIRLARFVAYAHLVFGVACASSTIYGVFSSVLHGQDNPLFLFAAAIPLFIIYSILRVLYSGWCETVNDVLLGIVDCWPKPLTIPKFFERLHEEAALNLARKTLGQIGLSEVAAVIPHRPHLNPAVDSLIYVVTFFGCCFYAPLSTLIKSIFWKTEGAFIILFLAYVLTNLPAYRRQSRS